MPYGSLGKGNGGMKPMKGGKGKSSVVVKGGGSSKPVGGAAEGVRDAGTRRFDLSNRSLTGRRKM